MAPPEPRRAAHEPPLVLLERPPDAAPERVARAVEPPASSDRSGTTSLPAAVGVEARTSAARSQSGVSCSWPTADTTGTGHAGDRADEPLVAEREEVLEAAAAAREDDHVDARLLAERPQRLDDLAGGARPLDVGLRDERRGPAGSGVWIVVSTSRFAAASLPVTRPIRRGSSGSGRFRSAAKSPSRGERSLQALERRQVRAEAEALDRRAPGA